MIIAINRVEDCATKNLVEDIMEVSKFFLVLLSIFFLEISIGLPIILLSLVLS